MIYFNEKMIHINLLTFACVQPKLLRSSGVIEKIDELDDIITLQDCNNKQTVEWNFPDITQCPVELCRRELGSRLDAFNHFKHRHLKNAQYCSKCSEPIEVYRQEDVQEHEYRAHQSESDATSNASKPSSSSTENVCHSKYQIMAFISQKSAILHFFFQSTD